MLGRGSRTGNGQKGQSKKLDEAREDFLKANYVVLKRLCKSKDFRARLRFDWALVLGLAAPDAAYYVWNYVQTGGCNPSTVRVGAPVSGMHHRPALVAGCCFGVVTARSSCAKDAL